MTCPHASAEYRAHLQRRLVESDVPEHLHPGLITYLADRRPPGSFLSAVLTNDLKNACAFADDLVQPRLVHVVFFLYNYAPAPCWGSPAHVAAWLAADEPVAEVFE